jgi:DNA-binding FadR family transcriptional regulator
MASGGVDGSGPLNVPPAYAVVVEHLRRAIHLGSYAPGEKLPPERTLAPQLGVSRVTLREAIRVLEAEGYVTTRRGASGGVTVKAQTMTSAELRERARGRREEIDALLEFRRINERLAAERAATRIDANGIVALEGTIRALQESTDLGGFRQADSAFHLRIAAAADFDLLRSSLEEARARMFWPIDALDYELIVKSTVKGHGKILDALRAKNAAAAGRAMSAHISKTIEEINEMLAQE